MNIQEIATDDIDELFAWGAGWEHKYLQLSRGRLGFRTRVISLPDVEIEWNSYGQAIYFQEVLEKPQLFLGMMALRDRVLVALHDVLQPWTKYGDDTQQDLPDETRAFALVKLAEQVIDQQHCDDKLVVADLAAELDTSERVLYEAFSRCLRVGPYEYHLLCRLHRFREWVVTGVSFGGKISEAAMKAGFPHMGRFTQMYRRQFGETPRQTMRRRDAAS